MDDNQQNIGVRLFQAGRYAEAAEAFRHFLAQRPSTGLEADTRRRLADTLDILGQAAEAAAERELIGGIAAGNGWDPIVLMAQGDLLKREQRNDEACATYEQALRLMPPFTPATARAYLMAKLAVAHYEASRPAKTVIWAGASLANQPDNLTRLIMHRMAGVGYSGIGDLEQAEKHYKQALELAEASEKPAEVSASLMTLASIQHKRGQFEAALATARRSSATFPHPGHGGHLVEAECLRDMGRFAEARSAAKAMNEEPSYDQPEMKRRTQVMCALTLAWIEALADCPEAALEALKDAWAGLGISREAAASPPNPSQEEDKLVLYSDATAVRVYAQLGQAENSRRMQESVESRLTRFDRDQAGLRGVYSEFAPAAFALGDFIKSRDWWHKYLNCQPDVVGLTKAHYGLGQVLLGLGETDAAREAFAQAVAPGIDSIYARRAQARLDELGR